MEPRNNSPVSEPSDEAIGPWPTDLQHEYIGPLSAVELVSMADAGGDDKQHARADGPLPGAIDLAPARPG